MKTLYFISILLICISCSKTDKQTLNQNQNDLNQNFRLAGLTSLDIPEECLESPDYDGEIFSQQFQDTIWYNDTEYIVDIEIEWSENDKFIFIGATSDWVEDIELPIDVFTDEDLFYQAFINAGSPSASPLWEFVKKVVIGEKKCQPCVLGWKNCFWDHWLLGTCCWTIEEC